MRTVIAGLAPFVFSLVTFVFGGGLVYWWDRTHPETSVCYEVKTESIPSRTEMPFDSFTRVTLWNPSRRIRATQITATIHVPTDAQPAIGDITTPEALDSIVCRPLKGEAQTTGFAVSAERLAPRSEIVIPIWWRSRRGSGITVTGCADQCTLTSKPTEAEAPQSANTLLLSATVAAAVVAVVTTVALLLRTKALLSEQLDEATRDFERRSRELGLANARLAQKLEDLQHSVQPPPDKPDTRPA